MQAKSEAWRITLLVTGGVLLVLSPVVGILPGPGGIFVAAAGLILVLRNSKWAKRQYVGFKRRWPKTGNTCDRVMRRPSALRRHARRLPQPD